MYSQTVLRGYLEEIALGVVQLLQGLLSKEYGMNIKTITNEAKRGCGYRKAGGLYLMAGKPAAECGKLPLEISVCPTCGQGIKPARGWTWIDVEQMFKVVRCLHNPLDDCCRRCPLSTVNLPDHPRMGLLWIGEKFYATPEAFLAEGIAQGISRRITAIPNDFELGKTWVLFAHRKTISVIEEHEIEPYPNRKAELTEVWKAGIFSCFLPQRIEYIVKDDDTEEKLERLEKRGVTLIKLVRTVDGNGNGVLDLKEEEAMA